MEINQILVCRENKANSIKKYIKDYEFKTGVSVKANVYKCGEETEFEHYGCWSMVDREKPDFHKPEFFGTMNIQ